VTPDVHAAIAALAELGPRELQVFQHLARGDTSGEIAAALAISPKTVSTYLDRLRMKLHERPHPLHTVAQLRAHAGWLRDHVKAAA
jgi:DNA-binding NarL/FixJ family response regulator